MRQTIMIARTAPPSTTGTYPPSTILVAVERKKAASTTKKLPMMTASLTGDQCHRVRATANSPTVVASIVPDTAKTYAEAKLDELPNATVMMMQVTARAQLIAGM